MTTLGDGPDRAAIGNAALLFNNRETSGFDNWYGTFTLKPADSSKPEVVGKLDFAREVRDDPRSPATLHRKYWVEWSVPGALTEVVLKHAGQADRRWTAGGLTVTLVDAPATRTVLKPSGLVVSAGKAYRLELAPTTAK